MAKVSLLTLCRFTPTAGGTTDWTFSAAVAEHQSPTLAGAVNGEVYTFRAVSADKTQWEISRGAYNSATGVFARTTVLYNSSGTGTGVGQSGAGTKITFSTVPQVIVTTAADEYGIGGQLPATATNDNAAAGKLGDMVGPTTTGPTNLTSSGVAQNLGSISLPAGDWEVDLWVLFHINASGGTTPATPSLSSPKASISTVSATHGAAGQVFSTSLTLVQGAGGATLNTDGWQGPAARVRLSLNATTTVFAVVQAAFSASSGGSVSVPVTTILRARRAR